MLLAAARKPTLGIGRPAVAAPSQAETLAVGLGDLKLSRVGEIVAYSLGSCVAICMYDPVSRLSAMAHVVLPAAPANGPVALPGKFADTAVPAMLEEMRRLGGSRLRLQCKIAGGAAVLSIGGGGSLPNIGLRNQEAVRAALTAARLRVMAEALGGNQGRTVRMDATTGRVFTRTVQGQEVEL